MSLSQNTFGHPELRRDDTAQALESFVEALLQGEVFGSAACRHFGNLRGLSKNQVIEHYIHHLSPFFIQALDEKAFLMGEKCNNFRMGGMTQRSVWSVR